MQHSNISRVKKQHTLQPTGAQSETKLKYMHVCDEPDMKSALLKQVKLVI